MLFHVPGSPWMFGTLCGVSLYVSATAVAAEPVEMSRHLFGDASSDNFGCALELANGDLLLAGTSRDAVTDDPDILVVRTDAQGATLWQQKWASASRTPRTPAPCPATSARLLALSCPARRRSCRCRCAGPWP